MMIFLRQRQAWVTHIHHNDYHFYCTLNLTPSEKRNSYEKINIPIPHKESPLFSVGIPVTCFTQDSSCNTSPIMKKPPEVRADKSMSRYKLNMANASPPEYETATVGTAMVCGALTWTSSVSCTIFSSVAAIVVAFWMLHQLMSNEPNWFNFVKRSSAQQWQAWYPHLLKETIRQRTDCIWWSKPANLRRLDNKDTTYGKVKSQQRLERNLPISISGVADVRWAIESIRLQVWEHIELVRSAELYVVKGPSIPLQVKSVPFEGVIFGFLKVFQFLHLINPRFRSSFRLPQYSVSFS